MRHATVKKKESASRLTVTCWEKLQEKSDEDCRPLSEYINLVLRKHVEQEEKKQKVNPAATGGGQQLTVQRAGG